MAGKKLELDHSGRTVAGNVARLRGSANLNYTELSNRLAELGRDIPPLAVRRIEEGQRRVDVDDLVALAVALRTSPSVLLMPDAEERDQQVIATGIADALDAYDLWNWLRAEQTSGSAAIAAYDADPGRFMEFVSTLPAWLLKEMSRVMLRRSEIHQLREDMRSGGERAEAARRRWDQIVEGGWPDGDD